MLKFAVEAEFLNQYSIHQVGDGSHREYWIPAVDLPAFNAKIVGNIEIVAAYSVKS